MGYFRRKANQKDPHSVGWKSFFLFPDKIYVIQCEHRLEHSFLIGSGTDKRFGGHISEWQTPCWISVSALAVDFDFTFARLHAAVNQIPQLLNETSFACDLCGVRRRDEWSGGGEGYEFCFRIFQFEFKLFELVGVAFGIAFGSSNSNWNFLKRFHSPNDPKRTWISTKIKRSFSN